ncbi:MAG: glycosyltransferase family 2 protein [Chloroflexi bacterium]|nr:glycosyltransferase family 2 protein [Chloroflexota bacterium]
MTASNSTPPATPAVSVLMAVYNGARYLRAAVDSILAQTLTDFEFIIVDDGSTDDTAQILAAYDDPRIVRLHNETNIGLTRALNRGLAVTRGTYIARQDADDASTPERLARQAAFLSAHDRVGLVGSGARWVDADDRPLQDWVPLTDCAAIHATLLWTIPFLHGTFMFRRACLLDLSGGYDESYPVAQDCDLLLRLTERWDAANLPDLLYLHRRHAATVTAARATEQTALLARAQRATLQRRRQAGWARVMPGSHPPAWAQAADRRWLSQRFVWWSAAARQMDRRIALEYLLIALALEPGSVGAWNYVSNILRRKLARRPAPSAGSPYSV